MLNLNDKPAVMLDISKLHPFKDHPYKVLDDDEMKDLTESVRQNGILSALIVRPLESGDGYEVISGHRRLHAAQLAGLTEVPAHVYDIDHDTAAIWMVDSNLHREHILPSEKAFALLIKTNAHKKQGKRSDLTSSQKETKLRTDELLAKDTGESRATVQRYLRLTHLVPELLQLVDEGKMAISPAVELSFLPEAHQRYLFRLFGEAQSLPNLNQAQEMKRRYQNSCLLQKDMDEIMGREKPNQTPKLHIRMDKFAKYFSKDETPQEIEAYIFHLLEEDHLRKARKRKLDMER